MDKYKILTLNNIAARGLERFSMDQYEVASEIAHPQAILLRSFNMHDMELPESLLAVGRAGAGVNNIPVEKMSGLGIPVFNAPGANSNAVKELVIAGMLLGSRNICQAWDYSRSLQGDDKEISVAVEKGKKQYGGFELPGRTLGVIGLGAIGVRVANAARALGMNVIGFDPTITVKSAWQLSADVEAASSAEEVLAKADFVTFHVPLIESTRNLVNRERLATMKDNVIIINLARNGIVDDEAVLEALDSGKVYSYISDFPSNLIKDHPRVIVLPHLGASTVEAEENCAIMVADEVRDYLENGIVRNSVNFPEISSPRSGISRVTVANENRPDMLAQISHWMGQAGLNINHMINESRGDIAYTVIDLDSEISGDCCQELQKVDGIIRVRILS
ncbi:MAG TPA: 3-phosphoglycerate dehydrogenase [Gammaproteobacteria bacterium]|nr:3-phosphoglycerate dehydrogenase [Gammaproteobacteria bacterium]